MKLFSPTDLFMESHRKQIEKKKSAFTCHVRSFCFIPFLGQHQEDVAIWCDQQHCANMVEKLIPICFSKQYFITVLLPFYPPIFFTCAVRFFYYYYFYLKWRCATQRIKIESILIPFFLFTPSHLVIFSLHSVVACFIFVKIHSRPK